MVLAGEGVMVDLNVRMFERTQREYGTKVAISNLLWEIGEEFMRAAGVKHIRTTYGKAAPKKKAPAKKTPARRSGRARAS